MSGYTFIIPGSGSGTASLPASEQVDQIAEFWGFDLWLDIASEHLDVQITPAGDYLTVEGQEALRQSLIRRFITSPGEYAVLPDYGAGVREYVKGRNTRSKRDELASRIRTQSLRDDRVESVAQVTITDLEEGDGIQIFVQVVPRGRARPDSTVDILIEVN